MIPTFVKDDVLGFDRRALDVARLHRVAERLAHRGDNAEGDYRGLFEDRAQSARRWKEDMERGVPLNGERRDALLEFEQLAEPSLRSAPYRLPDRREGVNGLNLRVLPHVEGWVIGCVRGGGGSPYERLSNESWQNEQEAKQAFRTDAWTRESRSQRQGR